MSESTSTPEALVQAHMSPAHVDHRVRRFAKVEGLGNDFVLMEGTLASVVGASDATAQTALASALCDRRRGIGADGIIAVSKDPDGTPRMEILNADGSRPEMCGNGLRCAALYALADGQSATFATDAGPHAVWRHRSAVRVQMRNPSFQTNTRLPTNGRMLDFLLPEIQGLSGLKASWVSIGNPHLVFWGEPAWSQRAMLGPTLERRTDWFPERINVNFARPSGAGVELNVFERGVGFTDACGTGACATVAAASELGWLPMDAQIDVRLPGGVLRVLRASDDSMYQQGPARIAYVGQFSWSEFLAP